MTNEKLLPCREAFEKHYYETYDGFILERDGNEYTDSHANAAWRAWQAARATTEQGANFELDMANATIEAVRKALLDNNIPCPSGGFIDEHVTNLVLMYREALKEQGATQGLCETTQTERFAKSECICKTYEGNLGSCKTYTLGNNGNCVYCDHHLACHDQQPKQPSSDVVEKPYDPKDGGYDYICDTCAGYQGLHLKDCKYQSSKEYVARYNKSALPLNEMPKGNGELVKALKKQKEYWYELGRLWAQNKGKISYDDILELTRKAKLNIEGILYPLTTSGQEALSQQVSGEPIFISRAFDPTTKDMFSLPSVEYQLSPNACNNGKPVSIWKKYPDEKPDNGSRVFSFVKLNNDRLAIFESHYNDNRFGMRYDNNVLQWCYETDLIASISQEK